MATHSLDALGLKCPQPVLRVAIKAKEVAPGDILEVLADCPSFPKDIEAWCKKTGKTLLFCRDEGGKFNAQIQF
ncbi:SirA-like protein [candidate division TA06 bacterium DG_26]|uniref:SirA-like protein n=1 Tax=candidate division TA06 bacterium DG_26 TaxID=1703771 RepID=A0A0S7WII2_UNCT6|nr:MAG: SirA-like protein [candidate division TA06 bacterium DG_26]